MMKKRHIIGAIALLLGMMLTSCNDFLDITPTGKVIAQTGKEYRALLTYEYKYFPEDRGLATLRSDEITLDKASTTTDDQASYLDIWAWNDLNQQNTTSAFGWRRYYHAIYIANYVMENKDKITEATAAEVNQMVGEAYMMRAYCHFLLANLYAEPYKTQYEESQCNPATTRGIPLQLKANVNDVLSCSSLETVYQQVLSDIEEAKKYLNVETWEEGYNYRFNTLSADALKARVCLYMGDWQGALDAAKVVIEKHDDLEDLTKSSSKLPNNYQSVENIVALERVMTSQYASIGKPNNDLLAKYRAGDQRKSKYFKQVTASSANLLKGGKDELRCSFRSGEAYLIAAEASAELAGEQGDASANEVHLNDARTYLKTLMAKRYASSRYTVYAAELDDMDQAGLLQAIYDERERELAFEGHRWFDLRRLNQPAMTKTFLENTYTLEQGDSRYTLRFPTEAVEANPGIENWE